MYLKFKQLFDNHDKGYLDRIRKCSPPCIPFIGVHLTMIYLKHEHNKLNVENQKQHIMQQQQRLRETSNTENAAISVFSSSSSSNEGLLVVSFLFQTKFD